MIKDVINSFKEEYRDQARGYFIVLLISAAIVIGNIALFYVKGESMFNVNMIAGLVMFAFGIKKLFFEDEYKIKKK